MSGAELGCRRGNLHIEVDDRDRQTVEQIANNRDGTLTPAGRTYEAFGECRCRHGDSIASCQGRRQRGASRFVVRVISVDEADDNACIEMDQRHSERRSSSSSGA